MATLELIRYPFCLFHNLLFNFNGFAKYCFIGRHKLIINYIANLLATTVRSYWNDMLPLKLIHFRDKFDNELD